MNLFTKNSIIEREVQKLDTKLKNSSYFHCRKYDGFGKLRGGTLSTYTFVALKKFAGFVLSAVCTNLTLFTLLGFVFFKSGR